MVKTKNMPYLKLFIDFIIIAAAVLLFSLIYVLTHQHNSITLNTFRARTYNYVKPLVRPHAKPQVLLSPINIKNVYNLNSSGSGSGTIAIIDAYNDQNIESDLNTFNKQYSIPLCTTNNGCFEKHKMSSFIPNNSSWAIEDALDVEWAHAIAPSAKILFIEARSNSGSDLMKAVRYANSRSDVVAVSMSWGGDEFSSENNYETSFISPYGAVNFASSGDNGHGTSWPAVSANVIGVGGTTLSLNSSGGFASETAWSGSGGGVSSYIAEPNQQITYNVLNANGFRASPDVAYNADPNSGYPVYDSVPYFGSSGWFQVGGTSAGSPQWAAIASMSNKTATAKNLYMDALNPSQTLLRDITSGINGTCPLYCNTSAGYDYVTGLGSPISTSF